MQCMIKVVFQISGLKVCHSIDDVGMTGHVGGKKLDFLPHTPHRNKLQMAQKFNVKKKTIKVLEGILGWGQSF